MLRAGTVFPENSENSENPEYSPLALVEAGFAAVLTHQALVE